MMRGGERYRFEGSPGGGSTNRSMWERGFQVQRTPSWADGAGGGPATTTSAGMGRKGFWDPLSQGGRSQAPAPPPPPIS